MKRYSEYKTRVVRRLLSPSMRFALKEVIAWLREQFDRASLWKWEITRFPRQDDSVYNIIYAGRKAHRELAQITLGIGNTDNLGSVSGTLSTHSVYVSELPVWGALCVPHYLRAIVPLGRPIEEILAQYDYKLRRNLLKQRPRYRRRQVLDIAEIDCAGRQMLHPFAHARHGSSAVQLTPEMLRKSALEYGRLDLLLTQDEVVACMLGNESIRKGKRYWLADRCGYPEAVFSDPKRLGETNSINNHMAIEWAIENGFDYYDIGLCFARPDDGLIQWKRKRGVELSTLGLRGYGYFHIRLPQTATAQFLWNNPLFAVEHRNLTLHLGLPNGPSDDEFLARYRQMGFGGISKIYLHCARPHSEQLLETLRSFYKHLDSPPTVKTIKSA